MIWRPASCGFAAVRPVDHALAVQMIAAALCGQPPKEIADDYGPTYAAVRQRISEARAEGILVPKRKLGRPVSNADNIARPQNESYRRRDSRDSDWRG